MLEWEEMERLARTGIEIRVTVKRPTTDDELDEKLRDRLKALQAREEALIAELGEQAMPERERLFGVGGPFERFGIEVAE